MGQMALTGLVSQWAALSLGCTHIRTTGSFQRIPIPLPERLDGISEECDLSARRSYCTLNTKNLDMYLQTGKGAREHPSPPPCRGLDVHQKQALTWCLQSSTTRPKVISRKDSERLFQVYGAELFLQHFWHQMWGFFSSRHQPILIPTGYQNIHFSSVIN